MKSKNKTMTRLVYLHAVTLIGAASIITSNSASAADVYWNNTSLNWNTGTATWNTAADGTGTTQAWVNGDSAIFSAGTGLTGSYTLVNGGVTVDNITTQESKIRVNNAGTLTLADTSATYDVARTTGDYDLRIDSVVANSGAGASSIIKNGAGILLFTNASNSFSGGITLNAGTLAVETSASNTALGTGTLTLAGGNFVRSYANAGVQINTANALNVTGTVNVSAYQQNNGNWILSGAWQAGSTNGNFNVANTSINGIAPSNTTIFVTGDTSAYTGTFSHTTGSNRLRFGAGNLGSTILDAAKAKFFTSGSTATGNPLDVADGTYGTMKMGELAGTGGIIRGGWSSGGNTTFEAGALNSDSIFAGSLQDNINGAGGKTGLTKVGTGTLALGLAGGNAYTNGTTVSNGTLLANNTTGSATGLGPVNVNGVGARLGGTGIIAPTGANGINVTTGIIAPGGAVSATTGGSYSDTVGTLSFNLGSTTGVVAMGSGTGFEFGLGAAGATIDTMGSSDLISLLNATASDFAFNSNSINFGGTGAEGFYKLFDTSLDSTTWSGLAFDGTTGIVSSGLAYTNLTSGLSGQYIVGGFSSGGDTGDIYLQVIPEPGAALLGGLGVLALLRRRRH